MYAAEVAASHSTWRHAINTAAVRFWKPAADFVSAHTSSDKSVAK